MQTRARWVVMLLESAGGAVGNQNLVYDGASISCTHRYMGCLLNCLHTAPDILTLPV